MQDCPTAADQVIDATRRSLLRAGLLGSVLLAGAALAGCTARPQNPAAGYRVLRDADLVLLRALIPGVLGPLLPAAGSGRAALFDELLPRIDLGFYRLGRPAQKMLLQLFDLLSRPLTRWALAGVGPWDQAGPERVQAFLQRWRTSSFPMFNGGYRVLVKLVASAFYASRPGWAAANYPGPPAGPYQALNS